MALYICVGKVCLICGVYVETCVKVLICSYFVFDIVFDCFKVLDAKCALFLQLN